VAFSTAFPFEEFHVNALRKVNFDVQADATAFKGDVLIVPMYQLKQTKKPILLLQDGQSFVHSVVEDLIADQSFQAESGSDCIVRVYNHDKLAGKYVALVGLGPEPNAEQSAKLSTKLAASIASIAERTNAKHVGLLVPGNLASDHISTLMLNLRDSLYEDNRFRRRKEEENNEGDNKKPGGPLQQVSFLTASSSVAEEVLQSAQRSEHIMAGVSFAKDLVGAPSNVKTPVAIAQAVKRMGESFGLETQILGLEECQKRKMGGYLGVQQGSKFPPQFVHLTYRPKSSDPKKPVKKIALVGKGLTFDSGGYNLKSGAGSMIELMKFDMGGCAAVFGAAKAIAQLQPQNIEVHFISAICENMVSAEAMRPGDILFASNGKSIEVLNTDAEGRLTLADALVYAERLQVDAIVDLATLTGACIMGLGDKVAGVYANQDNLLKLLQSSSDVTGEKLWHLPLEASYRESIKSTIADLKNISGGKGGGSITAALFLQEFLGNHQESSMPDGKSEKPKQTPWAHIDMAGPVWDYSKNRPTGFGVRLLVDSLLKIDAQPNSI
jgi:leucyl aminopeptidase